MEDASSTMEIPLKNSDEVIELDVENLPSGKEIIEILKTEEVLLKLWIDVALLYYKQDKFTDFVEILEKARTECVARYDNFDKHKMRLFDLLAAYYVQLANREKVKEKKRNYQLQATQLYSLGDKIFMYDPHHLMGRAYLCMSEGEQIDQADAQFNFVLSQSPANIPSLLGKACIYFNKKDYRGALVVLKRVLRIHNSCPASVRIGMAHCFLKLNQLDKAEMAFERALELQPTSVDALVGLAIMKINSQLPEGNEMGIKLLAQAYTIDPTHPMVLNHLANHYFFKNDHQKVVHLALTAFHNSDNDAVRAESCYQLGRSYHAQEDFDLAFQYYYHSTQLASPNFTLPYYGLGQMYLFLDDPENAAQCFEKVLLAHPNHYESMEMLGSIYVDENSQMLRDIARNYLLKVTEQQPKNVVALVDLAQLHQQNDLNSSMLAYSKVIDIITNNPNNTIPLEILNNVGALHYRFEHWTEAKDNLESALDLATNKAEHDDSDYYKSISITIKYNLARLNEAIHCYGKADALYKDILKEHPNYVDCYLRLGCMARDKGLIFVASDFFKSALKIDDKNPNCQALLGNLYISKLQWILGQQQFEAILNNPLTYKDSYSLIALGNLWLEMLHHPVKDRADEKKYQTNALCIFKMVLTRDHRNIWATNGIGAVLAHKGYLTEARDIFAQVREATADFSDVWLNIAHIYVEQKQYVSAIQMYENCLKRFYQFKNVEVMQYLARAYKRAGKLNEAKMILLKARRVSPHDTVLLFNFALVLQKLAVQILKNDKSILSVVLESVRELKMAQNYFKFLAVHGDRAQINLALAAVEAKECSDLLLQSSHLVESARKIDAEEREIRQKQQEEYNAFVLSKEESRRSLEIQKQRNKEQMLVKRQDYVQKTQNVLQFSKITYAATNIGNATEIAPKKPATKKKKKAAVRRRREKKVKMSDDSDNDEPVRKAKRVVPVTEVQENRIVSREFISTTDSDSDDDKR